MDRSEAGRKGNQAVREKNPDHQSNAGKRGIASKYFDGSIDDAMSWLRSRQAELAIAALVAEKQTAMLANGREIACEELPVRCDADFDPSYWRDMVSDRGRGRSRAG